MKAHDDVVALTPAPEVLEPGWSETTLAAILADRSASDPGTGPAGASTPWCVPPSPVASSRRLGTCVVVAAGAGAAVAGAGPTPVVKDVLLDFGEQPNTAAKDLLELQDPAQVARFSIREGLVAVWGATSADGAACSASTDGTWDGVGVPGPGELECGCAGPVLDHGDPDRIIEPAKRHPAGRPPQGRAGRPPGPGGLALSGRGAGAVAGRRPGHHVAGSFRLPRRRPAAGEAGPQLSG